MLLVETLTVERPEEMRGKRRVTWNKGPRSDWNRSIVTPEPRKCPSLKYVSVVRQLNKYKIGILLQLITCNKGKQHLLNGPRLYDIFMCFTICLSHTHTLMAASYHARRRPDHQEQLGLSADEKIGGARDRTTHPAKLMDEPLYLLNHGRSTAAARPHQWTPCFIVAALQLYCLTAANKLQQRHPAHLYSDVLNFWLFVFPLRVCCFFSISPSFSLFSHPFFVSYFAGCGCQGNWH